MLRDQAPIRIHRKTGCDRRQLNGNRTRQRAVGACNQLIWIVRIQFERDLRNNLARADVKQRRRNAANKDLGVVQIGR